MTHCLHAATENNKNALEHYRIRPQELALTGPVPTVARQGPKNSTTAECALSWRKPLQARQRCKFPNAGTSLDKVQGKQNIW